MSVRNAGNIIREARLNAGLTQEQLSEGVCSSLSLSRIESGRSGVSPSTFQALMQHAGVSCEAYPVFANRTDFDCFYSLKQTLFYLNSHQLSLAYGELTNIESMNWADNRFYYQEWLYLYCKLQTYTDSYEHSEIFDIASKAIHISRPNFDYMNIRNLLLSVVEIRLILLLAQEAFYLNEMSLCLSICTQISTYLSHSTLTKFELDQLRSEHAVVYGKYLLATGDFNSALSLVDACRIQATLNLDDSYIHELTFLTALCHYHLGNKDSAAQFVKTTFFSAHSIDSTFATICRNYVKQHLDISLPDIFYTLEDIPLPTFPQKKVMDTSHMGDGTYDFFSPTVLTIGALIRELRLEQHISQKMLCYGLCSKSKLSKIENGSLQPEIILAQNLLQRLGISERVFTFYGNAKDTKLQDLLTRLTKTYNTDKEQLLFYYEEINKCCTTKDTLYLQEAACHLSYCSSSPNEQLNYLLQALSFTVPDFNFSNILNYRLSGNELSILNSICYAEFLTNPNIAIQHWYKILEYATYYPFTVMASRCFYPVSVGMLTARLFSQKRYDEILSLAPNFDMPVIKSSLYFMGHINIHYCQVLGHSNQLALSEKHSYYAYYNAIITNTKSFMRIKQIVFDDFQIKIL